MKIRRCAIAGLALLVSMSLATAGCGFMPIPRADRSEAPAAEPDKPPRQVLAESTAEHTTTTYKYTMKTGEATAEGAVDPAAKNGHLDMVFADPERGLEMKLNVLSMGDDSWFKIDLGKAASLPDAPKFPKKWMHLDKSKVEDADDLNLHEYEPVGAARVLEAIVEVAKAGERLYDGTVDLTKVTDAFLVDEDHVKALGAEAAAVPFEATVDDKGRLVSLKIEVPAAGKEEAQTWQATYLDYGTAVNFSKPLSGEVVEAPAQAYEIFNS